MHESCNSFISKLLIRNWTARRCSFSCSFGFLTFEVMFVTFLWRTNTHHLIYSTLFPTKCLNNCVGAKVAVVYSKKSASTMLCEWSACKILCHVCASHVLKPISSLSSDKLPNCVCGNWNEEKKKEKISQNKNWQQFQRNKMH